MRSNPEQDRWWRVKMRRLDFGNRCPACIKSFPYRIPRKFWMRIFPGSRRYFCNRCGYTSMTLFKKMSFRLNRLPYKKAKEILGVPFLKWFKFEIQIYPYLIHSSVTYPISTMIRRTIAGQFIGGRFQGAWSCSKTGRNNTFNWGARSIRGEPRPGYLEK